MVATSSQNKSFSEIIKILTVSEPEVEFREGKTFSWSPKTRTVNYRQSPDKHAVWSLLHEVAHATLDHKTYETDFELLQMEVAAWEHSKTSAKQFEVSISEDYIQDCLDSYRDWLHRRSTCPTCGSVGLQKTEIQYNCHNCHSQWRVSAARFCRSYRKKMAEASDTSEQPKRATPTFR